MREKNNTEFSSDWFPTVLISREDILERMDCGILDLIALADLLNSKDDDDCYRALYYDGIFGVWDV